LEAAATAPGADSAGEVAEVAQGCLAGVREGLAEMPSRQ